MRVEIWSDVVCPWCYIGKRRFETALARFAHASEVDVSWRSFELDPSAPPSPEAPGHYVQRLARKYGVSEGQAQLMVDRVTAAAAGEGLRFRFDIARQGNTFDAHRLLHLAFERGVQDELKEQLDHATFTEGLPVSDHAALAAVALDAGLDEIDVKEVLTSDRYSDAVRSDEELAHQYGISAVPFFVIDDRYGIAGAQESDTMLEALERAWAERSPSTVISKAADACEDDGCAP